MINNGVYHGRNRRKKRDLFKARQDAHKLIQFETRDQYLGSGIKKGPAHHHNGAVHVEVREHSQDRAPFRGRKFGGVPPPERDLKGGGHQIGMGQDRPFGDTRSTACKLDQGWVRGCNLHPGDPLIRAALQKKGKMVPSLLQFQFLRRAFAKTVNKIRDLGNNHTGDFNGLAQGPDIIQDHIKGDEGGYPRILGKGL